MDRACRIRRSLSPLVQKHITLLQLQVIFGLAGMGLQTGERPPGHVKRNDIVVFNFPAGDTVALKVQNPDYYHLVEQYGREAILLNKADFGDVIYRPVDKRENYVKRCIGMPGRHDRDS